MKEPRFVPLEGYEEVEPGTMLDRARDAKVPDITRKPLEDIATFV